MSVANPERTALDGESNTTPLGAINGVVVDLDAEPAGTAPIGRVELFRLAGTVYTIPARVRVNIALKYLWLATKQGEAIADQYLLQEMLGIEGYQALMGYDDLKLDQLNRIMAAAQKTVLGSLEPGKG